MTQEGNIYDLPRIAKDYQIYEPPDPRSVLMIGGPQGGLEFQLRMPLPNRWHRYWHRVFFGFTWRKYDR